jgi:hypothetical protein
MKKGNVRDERISGFRLRGLEENIALITFVRNLIYA